MQLEQRFAEVIRALEQATPPAAAQAGGEQYQAFAQSLREMAVLETSMQAVAESGRQVLQRLAQGRAAVALSPDGPSARVDS